MVAQVLSPNRDCYQSKMHSKQQRQRRRGFTALAETQTHLWDLYSHGHLRSDDSAVKNSLINSLHDLKKKKTGGSENYHNSYYHDLMVDWGFMVVLSFIESCLNYSHLKIISK